MLFARLHSKATLGTVTSALTLPRPVGVPPAFTSPGTRRPYDNASSSAQAQQAPWLPLVLSNIIAPYHRVMIQIAFVCRVSRYKITNVAGAE